MLAPPPAPSGGKRSRSFAPRRATASLALIWSPSARCPLSANALNRAVNSARCAWGRGAWRVRASGGQHVAAEKRKRDLLFTVFGDQAGRERRRQQQRDDTQLQRARPAVRGEQPSGRGRVGDAAAAAARAAAGRAPRAPHARGAFGRRGVEARVRGGRGSAGAGRRAASMRRCRGTRGHLGQEEHGHATAGLTLGEAHTNPGQTRLAQGVKRDGDVIKICSSDLIRRVLTSTPSSETQQPSDAPSGHVLCKARRAQRCAHKRKVSKKSMRSTMTSKQRSSRAKTTRQRLLEYTRTGPKKCRSSEHGHRGASAGADASAL